ncbi:MAG: DUF2569 family protein [Candidatus Acidiferrales bacterium]
MSDEELTRLRDEIESLKDSAKTALRAELQKRKLQETPPQAVVPSSVAAEEEPSGIQGWLALLVFGLVIGGPISYVVSVVNEYDITKAPGVDSSVATLFWAIDAVLLIGLAAWSVYCGICLLRLKPNAPKITKTFMICLFLYSALGAAFTVMAGAKNGPNSADTSTAIVPFLRTFIGVIVWYSYLERSKRVKNTFVGN